ncbi:MAG TPA: PA14 domain-containing protein [Tepidisphaeraceae bacterium]|jgi:hypothetical protein|nr:PA14 domain-containing protein [Tepidisphaeraceae bacterium]
MLVFSAWKRTSHKIPKHQPRLVERLEGRTLLTGGLTGAYFDNMDFTGTKFTRIDPTINFNWGYGSPMSGIAADTFSVRWSGQVLAQKTERYTFYVRSDDGARLSVNGKILVDRLVPQAATEYSGSIDLVAGQKYDIHLDYFERAGGAVAQLSWSSPSTPKQIIPEAQMDPNPRPIEQPPPPPPGEQKPFKGVPFNIGERIEAEDYDIGGEGAAYHDVDTANRGGRYRSDAVDIEISSAGGFDVAYATAGEWLEYTINVPTDGNYALDIATASYAAGGTFHLDVDGLPALGPITVPATGGWQRWQVLHAAGLKLTAGVHVLRLALDTNGPSGSFANVDYLLLTPAPAPGVDLMIRNRKEPSYTGDNVYSSNGGVQQRSQSTNFYPATYELRVENDGAVADSFIVKSNFEALPGWRVSYYEINPGVPANPISLAGDGWDTGLLAPGEFRRINVDVAPSPKAGGGATRLFDITATAATDPSNSDTVRTITTLSTVRLPEIRRRNAASGDTYLLEVENKGNVNDAFRITGPAGGTGFTLRYFDDFEAGNDITAAMTSGGWLTPQLKMNRQQDIRVQVISSTADVHTFTITSTSAGDAGKRDTVTLSDRSSIKQPPFFMIGVWSQPTSLFSRWKGRGINTLMHFEPEGGRVSIDQWTAAANAAGLYMVRKPRDNPADDLNESRLLAWMHRDEPDIHLAKSAELQADHDKWKAIDPNRPILINFAGSDVLDWNGGTSEATYKSYLNATDWVSNSIYPVTGWYRPDDLDISGRALDKLEKWSNGKPQFAIIESGPQKLSWMPKDTPGPNPDQFRFEMWDAVIRGAKGIIYFPFSFTPSFRFDNTPPEIDAEMRKQHPRLVEIGPALLSPVDPPSIGMRLPDGLEGSWRIYNGKKYFIILNATDQPLADQRIRLRGVGAAGIATVASESRTVAISDSTITDSFGPYEAHVYVV